MRHIIICLSGLLTSLGVDITRRFSELRCTDYAALLRMSSKYLANRIYTHVIGVLRHEFPDTLKGLLHLYDCRPPSPDMLMHECHTPEFRPSAPGFHPVHSLVAVFDAVRRTGLTLLLPTIILFCCMQDTQTLCAVANECGLDQADREMFTKTQAQLASYAQVQIAHMQFQGSEVCRSGGRCRIGDIDVLRAVFCLYWLTQACDELCSACISNFWEVVRIRTGQIVMEQFWEELPAMIQLSSWKQLRKEHDSVKQLDEL